ncbi:MAG: MFS transporter [bacterium]|nr:MFS transporter [bacterium]
MKILRNRSLALLAAGGTISQLGDVCFMIALPWLVLQMTGSSIALGSVLLALAIPRAALMLFGGVLSDRFAARNVLLVTNLALMLCVASLALLAFAHVLALWMLYVLAVIFGTADAFAAPALKAMLPALVAPDEIQPANALLQSLAQLCLLVGAALAGVLIARFGLEITFVIDAFSFGFLIAALAAMRVPTGARVAAGSALSAIAGGIAYVLADRKLCTLIVILTAVNACLTGATQVGITALVHARFHSAGDFGALVSASATGSLVGIVLAGAWKARGDAIATVLGAAGLLGACIATLALPLAFVGFFAVLVLAGAIAGYVNVVVISALQRTILPEMRGRAMSLVALASVGIAPFSLAIGGAIAQASVGALMLGSGCALVLVAAAGGALARQPATNAR